MDTLSALSAQLTPSADVINQCVVLASMIRHCGPLLLAMTSISWLIASQCWPTVCYADPPLWSCKPQSGTSGLLCPNNSYFCETPHLCHCKYWYGSIAPRVIIWPASPSRSDTVIEKARLSDRKAAAAAVASYRQLHYIDSRLLLDRLVCFSTWF